MEYAIKKERLYEGGNERLRYKVEYPVIEGKEKINRFFEEIAGNCAVYCREALYEAACRAKERYVYVFTAAVAHQDDKVLSVLLCARLFRDGEQISQFLHPLTWDLMTDLMMPEKLLVRRYGEKGNKYREKDCFLYNGGLVSASDESVIKRVEKNK